MPGVSGHHAASPNNLAAQRRPQILALNFASAVRAGGGFLAGAQAQEETLARSSALYATLVNSEMYTANRAFDDPLYTDHLIYSPAVPVFRDDAGTLLDTPYPCSFVTSAAPNAGAVLESDPTRQPQLEHALRRRIERVLAVAARHGYRRLILGAFGCGVFCNDPALVARLFREQLSGAFAGVFDTVHFAVLDRPGGPNISAFTVL